MLRNILLSFSCILCFVKVGSADLLHALNTSKTSLDELNILTLNTWGLPIWYPKSNKGERYQDIYKALQSSEYNIICLQEVFDRKLRNELKPLNNDFQTLSTFDCKRNIGFLFSMDCQGGLMTFSKFPILRENFHQFPLLDGMKVEELIGEKGFLVTEIESPSVRVRVINTHLYSGQTPKDEGIRMAQVKHMELILSQQYKEQIPTFLAGDLNIVHPHVAAQDTSFTTSKVYDYISTNLGFDDTMFEISDIDFTYNNQVNPYAYEKAKKQKLDYIMTLNANMSASVIKKQASVAYDGMNSLSDHSGFTAQFQFITNDKQIATTK
ncbi:MAG: endonuclease/exonuclease/phosphatase family protein [Saprospiraceae bacterium]|nr:endonuclease/exonuclease/phosphatase family protein [Saprospiraceae bacterium]MBP7642201.1 endonuclease/exonuclease/phosphatase family protein [Saprospiraceae bacterium]